MAEEKNEDNSRGIPKADFIEDVPGFVEKNGDPEACLKVQHNIYGKYKFMENSLVQQKKGLHIKIPDIGNALTALNFLVKKQDAEETLDTKFEVADAIYASASIKPQDKVMLWLGANVMLEYDYKEAGELLGKNLENAKTNLTAVDRDLAFLKDQITISEVNIARIHNHKVQLKQEKERAVMKANSIKKVK